MRILSAILPAALISVGILSIGVGCTRKIYVPYERAVTDSLRVNAIRVDTVVDRDSIFIGMRGDTVVREVYRLRTRSRLRVDTVERIRVDTVALPPAVTSTDVNEKKLGVVERIMNLLRDCSRLAFFFLLIWLVVKFLYKSKKY